jgi:hypothetical protein
MATLEELQARRAAYAAAELKILQSQEYQVGQGGNARRNVRAELASVQALIRELDQDIERLQAQAAGNGRRVGRIAPGWSR